MNVKNTLTDERACWVPEGGGGGGEFKRLPSDDKLVAMFETLAEIGTLYGWVYHIEEQVDYLTSSDKAQNKRLKQKYRYGRA